MGPSDFSTTSIISAFGETQTFNKIHDFQINTKSGMLIIQLSDGQCIFPLERLRYFKASLTPQQNTDPAYSFCEVTLSSLHPRPYPKSPDVVRISDVIRYDWKINNGLLMVYGKTATAGFHLDHVVSYRLKK